VWATENNDGDMPCHVAVDYHDPNWRETLDNVAFCAGGMIYLRNTMKTPRDPDQAAIVRQYEKSPDVFQWPWEFLSHHLGRDVSIDEAMDMLREARNEAVKRAYPEVYRKD